MKKNNLYLRVTSYIGPLSTLENDQVYNIKTIFPNRSLEEILAELKFLSEIKNGTKRFTIFDSHLKDEPYRQVKLYYPDLRFIGTEQIHVLDNPFQALFDDVSRVANFLELHKAYNPLSAIPLPSHLKVLDFQEGMNFHYKSKKGTQSLYLTEDTRIIGKIFDFISKIVYYVLVLDEKFDSFAPEIEEEDAFFIEPEDEEGAEERKEKKREFYFSLYHLINDGATGNEVLEVFRRNKQYQHLFITEYARRVETGIMRNYLARFDIFEIFDMIKTFAGIN